MGRYALLIAGVLVAPLVVAGYVALTVLLFLPLLVLRRISRSSTGMMMRHFTRMPRTSGA